jgi:hypothetical protein
MYAPDVVRGNDGRYYLYYSLQTSQAHNQPLSVAVCDTPAGKYEFYSHVRNHDGTPFRRFLMSDPGLINDEGIIRLYYGWSLSSTAGKAHLGEEAKIPEQYRQFQTANSQEALIQAQMMLFKKTREEITREPQGVMGANAVVLAICSPLLKAPSALCPVRTRQRERPLKATLFTRQAPYAKSAIPTISFTHQN